LRVLVLPLLLVALSWASFAAEPAPTEQPEPFLEAYGATYRFRLGRPGGVEVAPGGRAVLFLRSPARDFEQSLYELDLGTGVERALLGSDAPRGSTELSPEQRARLERQRVAARGLTRFELSRDGRRLLVVAGAQINGRGGRYVVESVRATGERAYEVFDVEGATGRRLASRAERPPWYPAAEWTVVGEDPQLHAVVVHPRDFDSSTSYPVLLHVYGGPTSQMVRADPSAYLIDQWFADRGYVVVAIDGRGTPGRGHDWQRAVRGDVITRPLEDQVSGLRALARERAYLDLDRGWSFGGYFSAMAVLLRPDVFRAGIAGAPVVDWMDYDTHYTERYLDLPELDPEGYRTTNSLTHVERLERPLLVIHGTEDDNVYFQHSVKLADALFRAGKSFEFLPLSGFTHMVAEPLVTRRLYERMLDFFDRTVR
jgi:dipeptidyl aminopeptidase/acylaminoacyl peptidase